MLGFLVLLAIGADDSAALVQKLIEATNANDLKANQYTYVEQEDHFTFSKPGQPKKTVAKTFDMFFVEGETYKKLTALNGAPLPAKEQAKQEELLKRTAEDRRKQRRSGMFHKTVRLGGNDDLPTLFNCRQAGAEEVRGHKTTVLECTPKAGYQPRDAREKEALSFSRKLWVDQTDSVVIRSLYTVVGENPSFLPDAYISWDWEYVNGVWLTAGGAFEGRVKFAKVYKPRLRTEYHYSDYRRFDVQSTITPIEQ